MTELQPLEGYVVAPHAADEVVAPPYDALSPGDRAAHVRAHPRSFLAVLPEAEYTPAPEYERARQQLTELIHEGAFDPRREPFVALYRLTEGDHTQTGLVADLPVDELRAGRVRAHEHTRPERVAEITRFLDEIGMASSPVSLAFRGGHGLREVMAAATREPAYVTVSDRGVHQELWVIEEPAPLIAAARELGDLYITDGHHRTAAALEYAEGRGRARRDAQALLVVLFPADELRLLDYHRIVDEPRHGPEAIARLVADAGWEVSPLARAEAPAAPGEVLLVGDGIGYHLVIPPKDTVSEVAAELDVVRLHDEVLGGVLGIDDPRHHTGLRFVPGGRGVSPLVEAVTGTRAVGFALHPPAITELLAVADAGEVLPPKSTYFTPKARSGLLLRPRH